MEIKKFSLDYQIELNIDSCVFTSCPYFPCHEMEKDNFNCTFCYCPFYIRTNPSGGCSCEHGTGEWFYYKKNGEDKKIWDCSNCIYPHIKENAKTIFSKLYNGLNLK